MSSQPLRVQRRPQKRDFEGKTIARFVRSANNVVRFEFSDGTELEMWAECYTHLNFPVLADSMDVTQDAEERHNWKAGIVKCR